MDWARATSAKARLAGRDGLQTTSSELTARFPGLHHAMLGDLLGVRSPQRDLGGPLMMRLQRTEYIRCLVIAVMIRTLSLMIHIVNRKY